MKIAFFTEMEFNGKILRTHENMRTEFAWMCALNATHYTIGQIPNEEYDLGVVIIPKNNPNFNIDDLKLSCKQVAIMQEGPNWFWQDYDLAKQIWYFNTLTSADIIFTHNKVDQTYYQGLTSHPDVRVLPSLMIEEVVGNIPSVERSGVIIGGNFVSWYGGFDSYIIASDLSDEVHAPSMGRRQDGEEHLIKHLPYMNWKEWIHTLNKFKWGVHLMRTHAAGTFSLNCSYLGIPCIGYNGLDTQEILHPNLTVDIGDLQTARKLALELKKDSDFYKEQSDITKKMYKEFYSEDKFYSTFKKQFKIS
jgi:hypothetical protein